MTTPAPEKAVPETPAETPAPKPETAEAAQPKDDTDWKAAARKWESLAKENRNAAKELDAIKQANESAVEKAQREVNEAKAEAVKATAEALRFRVAAKHAISDEDAELFLSGSDEETLERQAARLTERGPSSPKPDPSQGAKGGPAATGGPAQDFANIVQNMGQ